MILCLEADVSKQICNQALSGNCKMVINWLRLQNKWNCMGCIAMGRKGDISSRVWNQPSNSLTATPTQFDKPCLKNSISHLNFFSYILSGAVIGPYCCWIYSPPGGLLFLFRVIDQSWRSSLEFDHTLYSKKGRERLWNSKVRIL